MRDGAPALIGLEIQHARAVDAAGLATAGGSEPLFEGSSGRKHAIRRFDHSSRITTDVIPATVIDLQSR